jgi:hypothetical protein
MKNYVGMKNDLKRSRSVDANASALRGGAANQQDTHLWLFLAPSPSSSLIVSG